MAILDDAIALLRQGRKAEAQQQLQAIIRENPKNISAWLWFAESFDSTASKIRVVETCLQLNPGNPQVIKSLNVLKAKLSSSSAAPDPSKTPAPVNSALVLAADDEPPMPPSSVDWDAIERMDAQKRAGAERENRSFLPPESTQPDNGSSGQGFSSNPFDFAQDEEARARVQAGIHYPFYMVWWIAFTNRDWRAYASLLEDPKASAWRAFEWLLYTQLVINLLSGGGAYLQIKQMISNPVLARDMPANLVAFFQNPSGNLAFLLFILVFTIVASLFTIIGFALGIGLEHLLCLILGGKGTYGRLFYAASAYTVPFVLISNLILFVPILGSCISLILLIYSFVLNVRAVAAAHRMDTPRATIVTLLPVILWFSFICILSSQLFFYAQNQTLR